MGSQCREDPIAAHLCAMAAVASTAAGQPSRPAPPGQAAELRPAAQKALGINLLADIALEQAVLAQPRAQHPNVNTVPAAAPAAKASPGNVKMHPLDYPLRSRSESYKFYGIRVNGGKKLISLPLFCTNPLSYTAHPGALTTFPQAQESPESQKNPLLYPPKPPKPPICIGCQL